MSRQILVNASHYETRVASLEDGEIRQLHIEREEDRNVVGNIYKGVVKRVLPGMQAAFLELGLERTAFLYVDDIIDEPFGTDFEVVEEDEAGEEEPAPTDDDDGAYEPDTYKDPGESRPRPPARPPPLRAKRGEEGEASIPTPKYRVIGIVVGVQKAIVRKRIDPRIGAMRAIAIVTPTKIATGTIGMMTTAAERATMIGTIEIIEKIATFMTTKAIPESADHGDRIKTTIATTIGVTTTIGIQMATAGMKVPRMRKI